MKISKDVSSIFQFKTLTPPPSYSGHNLLPGTTIGTKLNLHYVGKKENVTSYEKESIMLKVCEQTDGTGRQKDAKQKLLRKAHFHFR